MLSGQAPGQELLSGPKKKQGQITTVSSKYWYMIFIFITYPFMGLKQTISMTSSQSAYELTPVLHQYHRGHGFESHSQSLDILQVFLLQNWILYVYSGDKVCFSADSNPISLKYNICQSWTK